MKFLIAVGVGVAIHAALSLLERLIPAIGTVDPFLRLAPGLVAALMAVRALRQPLLFSACSVGALAAGLSGFLGVIIASLIGLPGGHLLPVLASVSGSSLLVGALGGALIFSRSPRPEPAGP